MIHVYITNRLKKKLTVRFDEGINDLPHDFILPNQRDLECTKQGEAFPAEADGVQAHKFFQLYVYSFAKMKEKTLRVRPRCSRVNFSLTLEQDPCYG